MTNPYVYGATGSLGQRWTDKEQTTTTRLNYNRLMSDHNKYCLDQIMDTTDPEAGLTGPLSITGPEGVPGDATAILEITVAAGDELELGVSSTNSYAWIRSARPGVGFNNLLLQPDGGAVGIGHTSAMTFPLEVQANTSANAIKIRGRNNSGVDEGSLSFMKYDGTTTQGFIQSSTTNMISYATTDWQFWAGGSQRATIASDGWLYVFNRASFGATISTSVPTPIHSSRVGNAGEQIVFLGSAGTVSGGYAIGDAAVIALGTTANQAGSYAVKLKAVATQGYPSYTQNKFVIAMDSNGAYSDAFTVYASANVSILPTAGLFFDGLGDTYIAETSADYLSFYVGGTVSIGLSTGGLSLNAGKSLSIQPTDKLYLDGGGDTYLHESSANNVQFVCGGTIGWTLSATAMVIPAASKFYLDGGGDTYIYESVANNIAFSVGGSAVMSINNYPGVYVSGYVALAATQKLYLDGVGDTYIYEAAGNIIDFVAGGTLSLRVQTNGIYTNASNLYMQGNFLYLDADNDTYINSPADDVIQFTSGASASNVYFYADQINCSYSTNSNAILYINWGGYQNGATQYRDLHINNGQNGTMSAWDGSGNTLTHSCQVHFSSNNLYMNGNYLVLDSDADSYIRAPSDDELYLTTGGTLRLHVYNTGINHNVATYLSGNALYIDSDHDSGWLGVADDVGVWIGAGYHETYFYGNSLNGQYYYNGNGSFSINLHGYANGTTQFRDLYIYDGKENAMSTWDGSAGTLTHSVPVGIGAAPGNFTLYAYTASATASPIARFENAGTAGAYVEITETAAASWDLGMDNGSSTFKVRYSGMAGTTFLSISNGGVVNISQLTASQDVQTDGSKNLVSVSDARWKIDRGFIDNALDIVRKLRPRKFKWARSATETFSPGHIAAQPEVAGFYAQEVWEVFPQGSPGGANTDSFGQDHWGLNNRALTAANTGAIQQLADKVDRLEKENSELKSRLEKLAA